MLFQMYYLPLPSALHKTPPSSFTATASAPLCRFSRRLSPTAAIPQVSASPPRFPRLLRVPPVRLWRHDSHLGPPRWRARLGLL